MKTIAIAALMILASASALPQISDVEQRSTAIPVVLDFIERLSQRIKDGGYDPLVIEKVERGYNIPGLFNFFAYLEDLEVIGASNIVINDIGHSLISNKFTFDVSIPEIRATLGRAGASLSILGRPANQALISGSLAVVNIRIVGAINVELADSGVALSELVINASLGGIESGIYLNVIGYDLSGYVNNLLGNILPTLLSNNVDIINGAFESLLMYILEHLLNTLP